MLEECPICFEEREMRTLHCGHKVCYACWPRVPRSRCPMCRVKVFPPGACAEAARAGDLLTLRKIYAANNKDPGISLIIPLAACGGNISILKWALRKNLPERGYIVPNAMKNGHFKVIDWVLKKGFPLEDVTKSSDDIVAIQAYRLAKRTI